MSELIPEEDTVKNTNTSTTDFDYMADVQAALLAKRTPMSKLFISLIGTLIFCLLVGASLTHLDESTVATGQVVPVTEDKLIQSLDGGIVEKILVTKGESVKKGQALVKLDDTRAKSYYFEHVSKHSVMMAAIARLTAEVNERDTIDFPSEIIKDYPDLVARETKLFHSRRNALSTSIALLEDTSRLMEQEIHLIEPMAERGFVAEIDLLKLKRELNQLKSTIHDKKQKFREDAQVDLNKNKSDFAALSEAMLSDKDKFIRTTIYSPVNGIIKNLHITTIGQVIRPGENILEIVPIEDRLQIKVRVKPSDIGFIHVGQPAVIKIATYDYAVYGGLDGKVEYIGADSLKDSQENFYYEVNISTEKTYIDYNGKRLPVTVGMTATVNIKTGQKTVLTYLLKPLLKAKHNALQER